MRRHSGDGWLLAQVAVAAAALSAPLAIASVHLWALAMTAALGVLAAGLTGWALRRSGEPFVVPPPGLIFGGVAAFIGLQLVPLPPLLVGWLAPANHEVFERILGPLGAYPAWRPLSLDPPATALELLKAVVYLSLFLSAAQLSRSRRSRRFLVTTLGVSALLVALIGFGHALWSTDTLFGVFRYEQARPPFLSTFGNPNHLSSLLALGATCLLARVLTERDRKIATLWALAYVAAGVGVLLTLSRGGIPAFLACQVLLGIAAQKVRRSEREGVRLRPGTLVVPAVVLTVLAVSAYLAWEALARELATASSLEDLRNSKLALWPSFWEMSRSHWLLGVGRGAFEAAYARFQEPSVHATFTHPENLVFQWVTEVGWPVGLLFLVGTGRALWLGLRSGLGNVEKLACGLALFFLGLHELVDFGLELAGLAVPASVALGVLVARAEGRVRLSGRSVVVATPGVAALAACAFLLGQGTLEAEGKALAGELGGSSAAQVAQHARRMALRHPADYFPHLVEARAWEQERPLQPARVVAAAARAMWLNPSLAEPHWLAARALRAIGQGAQARVEYRMAYERGARAILDEIVRVYQEVEALVQAVPDTELALADLADALIRVKRHGDAEAVVQRAIQQHGETLLLMRRLARVAEVQGEAEKLWQAGVRMSELAPGSAAGLHVRVRALQVQQRTDEAIALLEGEGLERFPLDAEVVLSLANLRLSQGDTRRCREALKKLPVGLSVGERVRALQIEAGAAQRDGQGSKALALIRTASTMRPGDGWLRWQYATALERVGHLDAALREAEQAAAHAPQLKEQLEKLRERVAKRKKELEEASRWKQLEDAVAE